MTEPNDDEVLAATLSLLFNSKEFGRCWWDVRFDRLLAHLPTTDDLSLITLKGHLLVEEILGDLLLAKCKDQEPLRNLDLGFYKKLALVRALYADRLNDEIVLPTRTWECVEALNALRNEFAHKLESKAVDTKLERFISLAFDQVKKPAILLSKAQELRMAIESLHAFLASFEFAAKREANRK